MKELIKGANAPLAASGKVRMRLSWRAAPGELDFTCFALDAHDRVLADDWFVFYNQTASPGGAIRLDSRHTEFLINLDALPGAVRKCLFIATLSSGSFRAVDDTTFIAVSAAGDSAVFRLMEPVDARSLLLAELYRYNDVWKIRAKGEGLKRDLATLAQTFGVDVINDTQHVAPGKIGANAPTTADPSPASTPATAARPTPRPAAATPTIRLQPPQLQSPLVLVPPTPVINQPMPASAVPSQTGASPRSDPATPPPTPTDVSGPPAPPHDRHEKLKTYATLAIAFGSLTTAITTLITQCTPHAPVVMVQPQTIPPTVRQPSLDPPPVDEKLPRRPRPITPPDGGSHRF